MVHSNPCEEIADFQIEIRKNLRETFKQIKPYTESYIKAYIEKILGPFTQMLEAKFSWVGFDDVLL